MCVDEGLKLILFIMVIVEFKMENVVVVKKVGVNNYIVKLFNVGMFKLKMLVVLGEF